jgi:hypothetical protein
MSITEQDIRNNVRVGTSAIFTYGEPPAPKDSAKETKVKQKDKGTQQTKLWYPWGKDNCFPQDVMKDARKSNVLKRALKTLARVHYGTGPIYFNYELVDGELTIKRLYIKEIEEWLENTNAHTNQMELILDCETFSMAFAEFYWSKSPKVKDAEIFKYKRHKAVYCRLEKQDEAGDINNVFISTKWPNPNADEYTKVPIYNPDKADKKFMQILRYASSDEGIYYELAEWDTVRQNGWLEVSYTVPMIKKAIFKNQATLKYHIQIPHDYFAKNCLNWSNLSDKEKNILKDGVETSLEKYLADVENSGKSVTTYSYINSLGVETGIKITAIDNKLKDGQYLPDATAGNAEVLFAVGLNPGIVGVGIPGSRDSQGSGSYVREELWKMQALILADRMVTLAPLRFATRANDWAKKYNKGVPIHWAYGDISTLETMNENKQGRKDLIQGQPGTKDK